MAVRSASPALCGELATGGVPQGHVGFLQGEQDEFFTT